MKLFKSKSVSLFLILAVIVFTSGIFIKFANAASFTSTSDTMSTQALNTASDHTLAWTLASGHTTAVNAVITIDFSNTDFTSSGTWQTTDFAFTDNVRSSAAPASVGTGSATCSGSSANNYIVNVTAATNTFAITTCTGWTTSAATTPTTFVIKGATGGTGTLTNTNSDTNSSVFTITDSVNDTDSSTGAVAIETNDIINITATVAPTLTFSNDDAAIGFGTLSSSAAQYANLAATGSSSSATTANTLTVSTNGTGGYVLSYIGSNLTSGSNTIPTANGNTTITGSAGGSAGTSEWGMAGTLTGTGTLSSGYERGSNNWKFVHGTTTTLASASTPASDSIVMSYIANIASTTPAGTYSTNLTYVATGTF